MEPCKIACSSENQPQIPKSFRNECIFTASVSSGGQNTRREKTAAWLPSSPLREGAWPAAGNENPAPASHEQSKCYVAPSRDNGYRRTPPAALFIQTDWISRVETHFLQSLSSFGPLPGNKNHTNSRNIIMLMSLTTWQFSPGTVVSQLKFRAPSGPTNPI